MACEEKGRFALVDLQQHIDELRGLRTECESQGKFFKVRQVSTNLVAYCCESYTDSPDGTAVDRASEYETPAPGSKKKSRCLVATAAYGSSVDTELAPLRAFRDRVARETRWGREFFERYESVYYRFSPEIAERMRADEETRELVKDVFVVPWVNYFTLALRRPSDWTFRADNTELAAFVEELRAGFERWGEFVELPRDVGSLDPEEAVAELNLVLDYVLRGRGGPYLDELVEQGELPLRYADEDERSALLDALERAGRTPDEIERILGRRAESRPSSSRLRGLR
jgi:hypothetical protein